MCFQFVVSCTGDGEGTNCTYLFPLSFSIKVASNTNTATGESEEAVNKVSEDIE